MADDTGTASTGSTASAAGSSPASPASASPPAASTPASATATPATASTPGSPSDPGPIPYARFKEVNDQLKTARAFQEQYGWAESFHRDPYAFVENWMDQLSTHTEYSPKLLAKAARMLQARRGSQPAVAEEPAPDIPITDAHGNPTGQSTYSAAQLKKWQEWNWTQREAALSERLGPLERAEQQRQHDSQVAAAERQAMGAAKSTLETLRQSPHFTQHEKAFKAFFAANDAYGDNVHRAWWDYFNGQVLPTLSQTEQTKVLDHLKTQAAGASVHPGAATTPALPKFKSFGEAARWYAEHPEAAEAMAQR